MEIVTLYNWRNKDDDRDKDKIDDRRREKSELDEPKYGPESKLPEIDDTRPTVEIHENPPSKKDMPGYPIFPFDRIPDLPDVSKIRKPPVEPTDEVN